MKTNSAKFYTCHKDLAKRDSDKVCSLLWMKIQQLSLNVKELHVLSDAGGGQNRKIALVCFLLAAVSTGRL